MGLRSSIIVHLLLLLTMSVFAQDGIRVVRGSVNSINGGAISQVRITTEIGSEFILDGGGYFEIRIPSQCKTLVFKADNYLPVAKIVDGSYLTVKFIPMSVQQAPRESSQMESSQKPVRVEFQKEEVPANAPVDKKQKKLQARIQSCYNRIDDVRARLTRCGSVEDLKDLFQEAVDIRDRANSIGDEELKSSADQLLVELNEKRKSVKSL